jgi:multiple sugar transport system ATP-binding protein
VQMRTEIKRVHQKVKTTTVYVTHDQVEAMTLADRVVVMNGGNIEQIGTPNDLYHHPKTRFVAGFIGSPAMNLVPAKLEANGNALRLWLSDKLIFPVPESRTVRYRGHAGKEVLFGLRPEHITETRGHNGGAGAGHEFIASLDVVEPMGMETMVFFHIGDTEVCGRVEPTAAKASGETMQLRANLDHMHLIDPVANVVL